MGFKFAIDRGGTFTDVYVVCPDGDVRVLKLLSSDPGNYDDASTEAIRQILETTTGDIYPKGSAIKTNLIDSVRIGTTLATNALLERMGEKCALAITAGFKDALMIGNQSRPNIFDLKIDMPQVLYSDVIEIEERILVKHSECELYNDKFPETPCITGGKVHIVTPLNVEKARSDLERVFSSGIRSIAVVLLHSYLFPNHENDIGRIAKEVGFTHVSLSHIVMPMTRIVPRGLTATVDAYLTPCIQKYIRDFHSGFLFSEYQSMRTLFMQSDGGLSPADGFLGSRAILSGPAGGVIGYAMTSYNTATGQPVVGFDMGGTSTDVSRYGGELEHIFESTTAGVSIQAPQLNIMTVAAGGGSLLNFRGGLYTVGPESAGADPGPVAYGRPGALLALTDANLVLGRLLPSRFPAIFGPDRKAHLDQEKALKAMQEMTKVINAYSKEHNNQQAPVSVHEVALGFVRVANETMCRPIRFLTQAKGYDTSRHMLACFGGAGGQHASSIARLLGMKTLHIHRYAGILSAYGIALADVVCEKQSPCQQSYELGNFSKIDSLINHLVAAAVDHLRDDGFTNEQIGHEIFLNMRYEGTDGALMCRPLATEDTGDSACTSHGDFAGAFVQRYKREFGFTLLNRAILVDDVRVRGFAKTDVKPPKPLRKAPLGEIPPPVEVTKTYFEEGLLDTRVYLLDDLLAGHRIDGPSIIVSSHSTVLVEPNCRAEITSAGDIQIQIDCVSLRRDEVGEALDPIQLSIFSHRFMSIAEQMGRVLQRTAISTNIKERLDFSCALFDNTGGLVANAPHIPVHLGAMQHAVEYQIAAEKNRFRDGDVLLSNHPCAGGSHLPDLTVITPVFIDDVQGPAFFVASRGHHADIGGSTPGSMPPHSKSIFEEGAVFKTFYLVKNGQFQEEDVTAALMEPRLHPGCSGTRRLSDNLSDLKAQVAANRRGIHLLKELVREYTFPVVLAYMKHIQDNAETSVRCMLRNACLKATDYESIDGKTLRRIQADVGKDADHNIDGTSGRTENSSSLVAVDYMDDGTQIKLTVDVDLKIGSAHFDFTGTGPEVLGNTNLPRAVLLSCLVYSLRCLVGGDMCLNHGCLKPITITVPDGTILSASLDAAVVGGNVLTSQRIVDVILAAFRTCAASQGCMNNITFGNEKFGYYETVAGGAGAGPGWHGRSGVHTHMTNTRITDPEILEQRYPVVLEQFSLRSGSGGAGAWRGGDGLIRRLKFRSPVKLSVLCERRVIPPYGLFGGEPGQCGLNLLLRANGKTPVNLGGKQMVEVNAGDVFILHTPGGGGYGAQSETSRHH